MVTLPPVRGEFFGDGHRLCRVTIHGDPDFFRLGLTTKQISCIMN